MKTKIFNLVMALALLLSLQTIGWAAKSTTIDVSAEVPAMNSSMSIAITRIDGKRTEDSADDVWDTTSSSSLDFGELYYDNEAPNYNNVFQGQDYFAIDVGVLDNSGTNWTLSYSASNLRRSGGSQNITVNTSAAKVTKVAGRDVESSVSSYDKAGLSGGWLRIYCGISNVPDTQPAGTYTGTLTITLSP